LVVVVVGCTAVAAAGQAVLRKSWYHSLLVM
jgi:hypothetical protein